MDYRDSPEEAAFRDRLRSWLADKAGEFRTNATDAALEPTPCLFSAEPMRDRDNQRLGHESALRRGALRIALRQTTRAMRREPVPVRINARRSSAPARW